MHNVKHIVDINDQITHCNYYFNKQHKDNSHVKIILISADNMLITTHFLGQNKSGTRGRL